MFASLVFGGWTHFQLFGVLEFKLSESRERWAVAPGKTSKEEEEEGRQQGAMPAHLSERPSGRTKSQPLAEATRDDEEEEVTRLALPFKPFPSTLCRQGFKATSPACVCGFLPSFLPSRSFPIPFITSQPPVSLQFPCCCFPPLMERSVPSSQTPLLGLISSSLWESVPKGSVMARPIRIQAFPCQESA